MAGSRNENRHRHDGFYFRAVIGMGYAFDRAEREGPVTTSKAWEALLEYALGGTLDGGWVLGGMFSNHIVPSPITRVDGSREEADAAYFATIGPFIDWFPDERGGWHLTALLGLGIATVSLQEAEDDEDETGVGFGIGAGGGYDAWVGDQWSLGITGRLQFVAGASDELGAHRAFIPTLGLSVLYH
jgi:hypothetical protein